MSHTIKLEDLTYRRLEAVRRKRETFSGAVGRLLRIYDWTCTAMPLVAPEAPTAPGKANHDQG